MNPNPKMYPRLLRRVRAVLIDEVVLLAALAGWWLTIGLSDASAAVKVGALCLVFMAVDPILVAWTGGTIGHHLMGMKVRRADRDTRVNLLVATVRGLLRYLLGAVSMVLILLTKRHQAIHDFATGTIVVLRDPQRFASREKFSERRHAH